MLVRASYPKREMGLDISDKTDSFSSSVCNPRAFLRTENIVSPIRHLVFLFTVKLLKKYTYIYTHIRVHTICGLLPNLKHIHIQ